MKTRNLPGQMQRFVHQRTVGAGLVIAMGCLLPLTGCNKNAENSVVEVGGKAPAPAASVDVSKLPPQEQKAVTNAIAQGQHEQSRAAQEGNAYMEDMKRMQNKK